MIENSGGWVYLLAPFFMFLVAIFPIPAEIPAVMNGMIFGAVVGSGVTWLGAVLGAWVSFELSRRFGRPFIERVLPGRLVDRADRVADAGGWPGLLLLRLVPLMAFTAINWGAGLTRIDRRTFLWTTAVGILPGTILFTSSGQGLGILYRRSPVLAGLILAVIISLSVVLGLWRRRRPHSAPAHGGS